MNKQIRGFLKEFFSRLRTENPIFFKIIQKIAIIIGGFTSAIEILKESSLPLPYWLSALGSLNAAIISIVAIIVAQLPNKS